MASEKNNYDRDMQKMHDKCERYMNYHVVFTTKDGNTFDGIIERMDGDCVIILVGEDVMDPGCDSHCDRQFGGRRRFRRFRRRRFPLSTLFGLSLLSFPFFPFI